MNMAPPPYPGPAPKKGLPPLAWVGIGCGGLILVVLVIAGIVGLTVGKSVMKKFKEHPALPMAEEVLAASPGITRLAEDREGGSITLSSDSTGEQVKTHYDEIIHGKVTLPDASGTPVPLFQGDLTKVPAWVPRYPKATGTISLAHQDLSTRVHGIFVEETTDSVSDVETFSDAEAAKLFSFSSTSRSTSTINGLRKLRLSYASGKRKFEILAHGKSGSPTTVMTVYTEEK